jgi:hypothetical protein
MSQSQTIPSPEEFYTLIHHTRDILDIGRPPKLDTKNQFGIEYGRAYVDYTEKSIKALAKAHLYLHSLKPRIEQIKHYVRWHPTSKDAKVYTILLDSYEYWLQFVSNDLTKKKQENLPLEKEILRMGEVSKKHHEDVEVPAAKRILEQMNRNKTSANAQRNLRYMLNDMEKKEANEARELLNARRKEAGIVSVQLNNSQRQEFENRRKKLETEANEAEARERQNLEKYTKEFEGWNKVEERIQALRNRRNQQFGKQTQRNTNRKPRKNHRRTRRDTRKA